jgi:hypothetical protein
VALPVIMQGSRGVFTVVPIDWSAYSQTLEL